jgi:hypothetical protein
MTENSVGLDFGQPEVHFENFVFGTWGQFESPSGNVLYLSTQVNLRGATDHDRRLISAIAPVREALDVKELEFSELLQRDLDDHRVLQGLIPYLMETGAPGDADTPSTRFFPPILAVLLPFENGKPSAFDHGPDEASLDFGPQNFRGIRTGSDFQFTHLYLNGQPRQDLRVGRLDWNSTKTRLVVIDGQHRAMALLALYRTLSGKITWASAGASAAKYMHFYEDNIKNRFGKTELPNIELPLTICVFPDLLGGEFKERLHRSARRLFVDVNKEAKTPSQARLVLLSETNLKEIFTRSLLDEVKTPSLEGASYLPLAAIEYDAPSTTANNPQAHKATCITDVGILREIVKWLIWGPEPVLDDIKHEPKKDKGGTSSAMRRQLDLYFDDDREFQYSFKGVDHSLEIANLKEDQFPTSAVESLTKRFINLWGRHVLVILTRAEPFSTFGNGLKDFGENWNVLPGLENELAKEALFDGVGTYFTLKKLTEDEELGEMGPTSWTNSWAIVQQKEQEFRLELAKTFAAVGTDKSEHTKIALRVLDRAKTNALQVAYVMAFQSINRCLRVSADDRTELANHFVIAINSFMYKKRSTGDDRRFFWAGANDSYKVPGFVGLVNKTQKLSWVYFRWLIIEIFAYYVRSTLETSGESSPLESWIASNETAFDSLVNDSRSKYVARVKEERLKADLPRDASLEDRQAQTAKIHGELKSLYLDWFEIDIDLSHSLVDSSTEVDIEQDDNFEDGDDDLNDY